MPVSVKICGITNLEDAQAAAAAGADYLGFIFYPRSKRAMTPEAAKEIARRLREQDSCPYLVGVFVNESADYMAKVMAACRLDFAQLSGEEVPSLVADVQSPLFGRAYKGIRPATLTEAEVEAEWYVIPDRPAALPGLLLDTFHPTLRGGTGETGDWALAASLVRKTPGLMLAGGLNPSNVESAVRQVRPFAVDVASGVEAEPGKKDHTLLRAFVAAAKDAA